MVFVGLRPRVVQRVLKGSVNEGRSGERADAVCESNDAGAVVTNFDSIADVLDTEFDLVEVIDDYAIFQLHVEGVTLHHVPRLAQTTAGTKTDYLHVFDAAVRLFPIGKILNVLFGLLDAGRGEDFIEFAFGEHAAGIEVADTVKDDPEVGMGVVNIVRGGGGEAEEQAELNDDQDEREDDAG